MKAILMLAMLITAVAHAEVAVVPTTKTELHIRARCFDGQVIGYGSHFEVYSDLGERFISTQSYHQSDLYTIKNSQDVYVNSERGQYPIGVLETPLAEDCRTAVSKTHKSNVILDQRFSFTLDVKKYESSCINRSIGGFSGKRFKLIYSDLILVDNHTRIGAKLSEVQHREEDIKCITPGTVGTGIMTIILSPLLIFVGICIG